MSARVLAMTMVAVLSLSVSPVFGQCWGSVATTYLPAETGVHDVLRSDGSLLRPGPLRCLLLAGRGLPDLLCVALRDLLWADRRGLSRVLRRGWVGACSAPRGSTWQGSPSETYCVPSPRKRGRRHP